MRGLHRLCILRHNINAVLAHSGHFNLSAPIRHGRRAGKRREHFAVSAHPAVRRRFTPKCTLPRCHRHNRRRPVRGRLGRHISLRLRPGIGLLPGRIPFLTAAERKHLVGSVFLHQRAFHRRINGIKSILFPCKANFRFGRMHVHIHKLRRHGERKHAPGEFALHQGTLVGSFQRGHHGAVFHKAPVYKKELHGTRGTACPGRRDEACSAVGARAAVHFQKVF